MKKKTNFIDLIPCAIAGILLSVLLNNNDNLSNLSFIEAMGLAIVVGFIVGIIWLLGKKLLASMNK